MNFHNFVMNLHPDPKTLPETFRRLQCQIAFILDGSANVVWQPAIRVGDKSGTLKNHNFRLLVQPAYPRRRGRSSGDAADNHNFHLSYHLSTVVGNTTDIRRVCISYLL